MRVNASACDIDADSTCRHLDETLDGLCLRCKTHRLPLLVENHQFIVASAVDPCVACAALQRDEIAAGFFGVNVADVYLKILVKHVRFAERVHTNRANKYTLNLRMVHS